MRRRRLPPHPGLHDLVAARLDAHRAHAGRSDSHQLYLRYANVRLKRLLPGTSIQIGRMGYGSGGEAASGNPKIDAAKLRRVTARLIGEFEWSIDRSWSSAAKRRGTGDA